MGYFDSQFITDEGDALLAKSTAGEGDIIFTAIHTGNGEYNMQEISRITSCKALKNEKQVFPVNDIDFREKDTRIRAVITNHELTEGYYIREVGLYARMEDEEEILFSISICVEKPTFLPAMGDVPIEMPVTNHITYSGDGNFTIEFRSDVYASLEMVKRVSDKVAQNIADITELHKMSEDTLESIHTLSTDMQEAIQTVYENANQFTLAKIAELINGAPATADTLKEIADLIADNKSVVEALDLAIGQKANKSDLDRCSKAKDVYTGDIDDLHHAEDNGIYWLPNINSLGYCHLLVLNASTSGVTGTIQIAFQYLGDGVKPRVLVRQYINATLWSEWDQICSYEYPVSRMHLPRVTKDLSYNPGANKLVVEEISESSTNIPTEHYYHVFTGQGSDIAFATQLALGMTEKEICYRNKYANTWQSWVTLIHSENIFDYAVPKKWKKTSVTGTNQLNISSIVSSSSEIVVELVANNGGNLCVYSWSVVPISLNANGKHLTDGYKYDNFEGLAEVYISSSTIYVIVCRISNNDYKNNCTLNVYYR